MRDESQLYDAYDVGAGESVRRSRWSAAIGAAVSLAVLGGVVAWAYKLGVRDAADVPVVRAVEGPARMRPDDPGGAQAAHQGRAVYDVMSGAPAPLETVVIAPPPERLAAEDAASFTPTMAPEPASPPVSLSATISSEVDSLVASVLGVAAPSAATVRAPAPAPRPGVARVAAAAPAATAETPAQAQPAAVVVDGAQVQLGAYLSEADALRMWAGFRARNGDLLAGRAPVVAPLVGANRTLYRLRASPFADMAEARALCAALRGRGEECLLVEPN